LRSQFPIKQVVESHIAKQLAILSFEYGTLTDEGISTVLEDLRHLNLKLLNVLDNYLSDRSKNRHFQPIA
jgi:hypothetical protein